MEFDHIHRNHMKKCRGKLEERNARREMYYSCWIIVRSEKIRVLAIMSSNERYILAEKIKSLT